MLIRISDHSEIPVCVHGTYKNAIDAIKLIGLSRMSRNHIHMASDFTGNGVLSGIRRDVEVLIFIDVAKAMAAGIPFYRSQNNVILSPGPIHTSFFKEIRYISQSSVPERSEISLAHMSPMESTESTDVGRQAKISSDSESGTRWDYRDS